VKINLQNLSRMSLMEATLGLQDVDGRIILNWVFKE
jgi:hypothetical protein